METVRPQVGSLLARFRAQIAEGESSDRSFGLLVGGGLIAIALIRLFRHGDLPIFTAGVGALLLLVTAVRPQVLRAPKRAWLFLGFMLGLVVNPIVLAVLFYLVITPIGRLMQLFGSDPMRRKPAVPPDSSYWIPRAEAAVDMRNQF